MIFESFLHVLSGPIDNLYNVVQTSDGGLLFSGFAHVGGQTQDAWLWKLDENGCATIFRN